jgi:hypothetical protein
MDMDASSESVVTAHDLDYNILNSHFDPQVFRLFSFLSLSSLEFESNLIDKSFFHCSLFFGPQASEEAQLELSNALHIVRFNSIQFNLI